MDTALTAVKPRIDESWLQVLKEEFSASYFSQLKQFLLTEKKAGFTVYPPGPKIFSAFDLTPFDKVKVVIIGQDPYHGAGQAHGLCFSVMNGIKPPPSLVNIFKELNSDLGCPVPSHGNLESWAHQGVFLLNATLTVRANQAGSHQGKGWEKFTDTVIRTLSGRREKLVFLLWGKFAQAKEILIDASKHYILKAAHPSPLAGGAFSGCKHFSRTNEFLAANGLPPVDWQIR